MFQQSEVRPVSGPVAGASGRSSLKESGKQRTSQAKQPQTNRVALALSKTTNINKHYIYIKPRLAAGAMVICTIQSIDLVFRLVLWIDV